MKYVLDSSVAVSSQTRAAITDCIFLALAEREGCDFLTADDKLVNNLPGYPIVSLDSL